MNISLIGPPGSGKGTQAKKIAEKYNLIHISTGDLLREEVANQTELGKTLKLGTGTLVSDEIIMELIKNRVLTRDIYATHSGFVFDGVPRTIEQAIELNTVIKIDKAILLMVDDDEAIRRIIRRGEKSGRADDNTEIAKKRLKVYTKETYPIKQYYSLHGTLGVVKGTDTVEEVFESITKLLDN